MKWNFSVLGTYFWDEILWILAQLLVLDKNVQTKSCRSSKNNGSLFTEGTFSVGLFIFMKTRQIFQLRPLIDILVNILKNIDLTMKLWTDILFIRYYKWRSFIFKVPYYGSTRLWEVILLFKFSQKVP